ncbi:MAG: hypothetical protein Ta2F_17960 [Termitinemataceae bacterium]|nr:MAG: hypothetical protein Ta2F_17960 [Termitinemataceae bacterium]
MKNKGNYIALFVCTLGFIASAVFAAFNFRYLRYSPFEKNIFIDIPLSAKYLRDGNVYLIDNAAFRLICMSPQGKAKYTINIDKMADYTKLYDFTVDDGGNLYLYKMGIEYDAFLTKYDAIAKYDNKGRFIKNILTINYNDTTPDRPKTFAQFGSLNYNDGILTFSRVQKDGAELYMYDVFRDVLKKEKFTYNPDKRFYIASLTLKDFSNFIFSTRDGNIYEVRDSGAPVLRASLDFDENKKGIIPWFVEYDNDARRGNGNGIIFYDMYGGELYKIDSYKNTVSYALSPDFFDELRKRGENPGLARFGFYNDSFAGVFGNSVWFYNGTQFKTYNAGLERPFKRLVFTWGTYASTVFCLVFLILSLHILFVRIFNNYVSLLIKQTVVIVPITISAFIVLYLLTFRYMTERLDDEIMREVSMIASIGAKSINGDDVESIKSIKDYNTASYKKILKETNASLGSDSNESNKIYYSAVYKVLDNMEYFICLSSDDYNIFRPYGYVNIESGTPEYDMINYGKVFNSMVKSSDGTWVYGNAPIYNSSGKFVGIFEVGFDYVIQEIKNKNQQRSIFIVASLIIFIILFALIMVSSVIVRELAGVAGIFNVITDGDYSARAKYNAKDELGTVSIGLNTMAAQLERQITHINELNKSFLRFVPMQFLEYLGTKDITKMNLGDHVQRDISVLFFDIRAFSINSEIMSAKDNFTFINEILGVCGPIFREFNGFVDKYIGDAAMVLFPSPLDAVHAGIKIYKALVLNTKTRITIGGDGINIGVGVHTGTVMMGVIGEAERLSSTVISKNVNLASRLESLTKQVGAGMLISQTTLNKINENEIDFEHRFIGMIQPAGVNEIEGLVEVLDAQPRGIRETRTRTKRVFESGVRKYHTKEYKEAYKRFQAVVKADPLDLCARNCLEETKKHLENPKLPSVFVFSKK